VRFQPACLPTIVLTSSDEKPADARANTTTGDSPRAIQSAGIRGCGHIAHRRACILGRTIDPNRLDFARCRADADSKNRRQLLAAVARNLAVLVRQESLNLE
jgi:hypothetical protein